MNQPVPVYKVSSHADLKIQFSVHLSHVNDYNHY
jgi:hypothetical protein